MSGLQAQPAVVLGPAVQTPRQAASSLGVQTGQIVQCVMFRRKPDAAAVLVLTSGDRRLDERKIEALVCAAGGRLVRANADFVKNTAGPLGAAVSPAGQGAVAVTLMDASLFRFNALWLADGQAQSVRQASPQDVQAQTGARVADVSVHPDEERKARQQSKDQVASLAATVGASGDKVPSPCISVCRINADSGLCEGCYRTLKEISGWSRSGPQAQRLLWQAIGQRMASEPD